MMTGSSAFLLCFVVIVVVVMMTILSTPSCVNGYVPKEIQLRWKETGYGLNDAMKIVEEAAKRGDGEPERELYYAVRYIDRNAHKLYPTMEEKADMWKRAKGSWELRLAYEDCRTEEFYPYPDFRDYAMAFVSIEDSYFGKGIAKGPSFCFVSMGGPAMYKSRTRQIYMNYEDFYISGNAVPDWDLSYFMRGYARNWYERTRNRPPLSFTLIAVNDRVMVVRGSKTGGMAIFRRMKKDMRPAAYGDDWDNEARYAATYDKDQLNKI